MANIYNPSRSATRDFHWVSSVGGNEEILAKLNAEMARFYSEQRSREEYQRMVDTANVEDLSADEEVTRALLEVVCGIQSKDLSLCEIGCGTARLYRQLRQSGYAGKYCGVEVSEQIVRQNQHRHRDAEWFVGTTYELAADSEQFDIVVAFYVLEHTVFPARALVEMVRVLKVGGSALLVFPDFACSGRLASQRTGFSPGSSKFKLLHGRPLDALVSLYDNRFRLPRALRTARQTVGAFPVNTQPVCLAEIGEIAPDTDATYIASKQEIVDWALERELTVDLPSGDTGPFREHAFLRIRKPSKLE